MKRFIVTSIVLSVILIISSAYAKHTLFATGRTELFSQNGSGVKGIIDFTDNGRELLVAGTAAGLNPSQSYVSLIYDNGSVPGGPDACDLTIFDSEDPDFILPTMFIGYWVVNSDGSGALSETNTNGGVDYVPLDKFRTISIMLVDEESNDLSLMSCGEVAIHPKK